jgi:hypothetical protein
MRNIVGMFVLIATLSVNAWVDPNELKVGSIYQVSEDTPLMSTTTSSVSSFAKLGDALSKSHKILKKSQFTVLEVKNNKNGYPDWYKVDASGVMQGWIKVIALYGQDLDIPYIPSSADALVVEKWDLTEKREATILLTFDDLADRVKCTERGDGSQYCRAEYKLSPGQAWLVDTGKYYPFDPTDPVAILTKGDSIIKLHTNKEKKSFTPKADREKIGIKVGSIFEARLTEMEALSFPNALQFAEQMYDDMAAYWSKEFVGTDSSVVESGKIIQFDKDINKLSRITKGVGVYIEELKGLSATYLERTMVDQGLK